MTEETLDWGDADESACHKMIRFIPLTGTWWLYRMVSVCHTNHHCTSIPCAAVPLCDSGTWNHTSRFDGCSCFAQNPTVNVFGNSFCKNKVAYVFVLMQLKHVWLIRQFFIGAKICVGVRVKSKDEAWEREKEKEREKDTSQGRFFTPYRFFSLPVIKKS